MKTWEYVFYIIIILYIIINGIISEKPGQAVVYVIFFLIFAYFINILGKRG